MTKRKERGLPFVQYNDYELDDARYDGLDHFNDLKR